MRFKNGLVVTVMLALSLLTMSSMVLTDEFAHATYAEAQGFDALAHSVFGDDAKEGQAK